MKEFKEFISRGNVVDLAVGVIIGAAFGKIVTSLVEDIIMPIIGWLINGISFVELKLELPVLVGSSAAPVSVNYGNFLQILFNFVVIAFCIFMIVKLMNKFKKKNDTTTEEKIAEEVVLLREIRDALKK